jgi:hypothetical protein
VVYQPILFGFDLKNISLFLIYFRGSSHLAASAPSTQAFNFWTQTRRQIRFIDACFFYLKPNSSNWLTHHLCILQQICIFFTPCLGGADSVIYEEKHLWPEHRPHKGDLALELELSQFTGHFNPLEKCSGLQYAGV